MKENASKALVELIAATTGLTVSGWSADYDAFDITISSSHDYEPDGDYGPKIDVQLKCTGQERAQRDDHIAWSLHRRAFDKLSRRNRANMAALCVVVVPDLPGHWLSWTEEVLMARAEPYFLLAQDFPAALPEQDTQTIHLPRANRLTPVSLQGIMETASKWRVER